MDPSEYECAICQNLLLDPVVGPCGHDYCSACIARWRSTSSSKSSTVACPLCREPIPYQLGVCVRLRETIQRFFPEEVKKRRIEVQERKVTVAGASQTSTTSADPSTQRGVGSAPRASSIGSAAPHPSSSTHQQAFSRLPSRQPLWLAPASLAAAAASTAPGIASTQPLPSGATPGAMDTWVPPATLTFALGWHDPSETRGRRSLGRRRRAMMV